MDEVKLTRGKQVIPTYVPKKAHELPMFFENKPYQGASGRVYPIPYCDGISDEKTDVEYEVYTLENEYIKTQVVPALGGKILRGLDKVGGYDFLYYNEVVKPALVGLAGPWISGGIEFNWPQHHRPTTFMPLEAVEERNPDGGRTVWTGEVEPFDRMKAMAGITVDPGRSYIRAKVRIYNRTPFPQRFMWWANLAVPVNNNYRTVFPPDCEWVNDHDRRAVLEWPIAKGVYQTARPFDFGKGTNLSHYDAVRVPSSYLISQGQSDMDFVSGYDVGLGKGIATVANHHLAPGKKMWHWGIGDFGDMWCSNLTDKNGPYIELMTGVFTDNQPDFTWIAPYETKEFEQYWYPVREIGEIKNATIDAAVNVERRKDGLYLGFNVTGVFTGCTIVVTDGGKELLREKADLSPEQIYQKTIAADIADIHRIRAALLGADGKELVAYTPYRRNQKQPIAVRKPVKRPAEYASVEELYINGLHLEQYKQHNFDPRDYYLEALKRDPGDIRCNTSMGRLALKDGKFRECVAYCDTAIARLTSRNQHPADTEAFYLKGLALQYLGEYDEAYDVLYRAAWNYPHRSAAYFQLATLDCRKGEYPDALEKLEISLGLNAGHSRAVNLKTAILRHLGRDEEARKLASASVSADLLDLWARVELSHYEDNSNAIREMFGQKPENYLDVICDYLEAGLVEDALYVVELSRSHYPLLHYYRGYCRHLLGQGGSEALAFAASLDTGLCFPARLEDIAVLKCAIANNPADACYYLGCLCYDRFRYDEAVAMWEQCISRDSTHAKALRNLALAYFDKRGDAASARVCMERALKYRKDPRLLFEYQQLLKNTNVSVAERLDVYGRYPELLAQRDDCYLDRIVLLCQQGRYAEAIHAAKIKRFHIYEGGEGNLTKQHAWMHVLYANELAAAGKAAEAYQVYMNGVNMPKSYAEAKTWFNQEAHIFYYLGTLLESLGKTKEAANAFEEAAVYKAAVSELSMFRALALRKLMRFSQAQQVLTEMLESGDNLLKNKDMRSYYGVGSPTPMPFEYDIVKINSVNGHILRGYALLGLGRRDEAEAEIAQAATYSPNDFRIYAFHQVKDTF